MQAERLKFLLDDLKENPDDPFNYYALALEYQKTDKTAAERYFSDLLELFPEYLPAYYHAAGFFFELDENEKAEALYLKGIQLAEKLNNLKTLKELKGAYQQFKDETDD